MANKSVILKGFNDHFTEFVDDIANVFPENLDIITTKNALSTIRKANPRLIIVCWDEYVSKPYASQIEQGDMSFFIDKDYTNDLRDMEGNGAIMEKIERLRGQVRQMKIENQNKAMQYVQNLSKLASAYVSM